MSLNKMLWSVLDLSCCGSIENVEVFDVPQSVVYSDVNNPLQYGVSICYSDNTVTNLFYIMHASCKNSEACKFVRNVYEKYKNDIEGVLGVSIAIHEFNPALYKSVFSKELIDKYGSEL